MTGTSSQIAAEWLARTLIRGDPFITVGVQDSGEVLVGFGTGSYVITIREPDQPPANTNSPRGGDTMTSPQRPNTDIRVGDIVRVEFDPTEWEVLAVEPGRVALTRTHTNEAGWPVITHCWIDPGRVWFAREAARPKLQLDPSRATIRRMSAEETEEWRKTLPPQPEISTPQSQVHLSWDYPEETQ